MKLPFPSLNDEWKGLISSLLEWAVGLDELELLYFAMKKHCTSGRGITPATRCIPEVSKQRVVREMLDYFYRASYLDLDFWDRC